MVDPDLKGLNNEAPSAEAQDPSKLIRPRRLMTANTGEEVRPYKKVRLATSLDQTVTLLVGKEEKVKTFIVHKNILCAASPFFEAACKPEWTKDGQVIKLPEEDPQAVQIMINWIYHNKVTLPVLYNKNSHSADMPLVKLYVLGQQYQMPTLRNDALDAIFHCIEGGSSYKALSHEALDYAWQNTSVSSPLRSFLLVGININSSREELEKMRQTVSSTEFWIDLAVDLKLSNDELRDCITEDDAYEDFCDRFHVHEKDRRACSTKKTFTWVMEVVD